MRILKEHGYESQVYKDTEEKWEGVEGLWRKYSGISIANTVKSLGGKAGKGKGKEEYNLASVLRIINGKDVQSSHHVHKAGLYSLSNSIPPLSLPLEPSSADLADPAFVLTLRPQSQSRPSSTSTSNSTNQNLYWPAYIRAPIQSKRTSLPSSNFTSPLSAQLNIVPTNHSNLSPSLLSPSDSFRDRNSHLHPQPQPQEQAFCPYCPPAGRWLPLNGPYQDDMDFRHGISGVTGRRVDAPVVVAAGGDPASGDEEEGKGHKSLWGLCGRCEEWVGLGGEGRERKGRTTGTGNECEDRTETEKEMENLKEVGVGGKKEEEKEKDDDDDNDDEEEEEGWFLHSFGCY